jgi:hypothetical protein
LAHRLSAATLSFFIALHNLDPGKRGIGRHFRRNPNKQWLNDYRVQRLALGCAALIALL